MIKKLYFDKTWQLNCNLTIEIIDGKIRKYNGGNFTPAILLGGSVKREIFELKSDFTLEKVHRYDRKKSGIDANYRIECGELFNKLIKPCYIRLNPIEKFIIDYSKKETIFHEVKLKQLIVIGLFVTLPIGLLIFYLSNPNVFQKNSPNPSLKTINHVTTTPTNKAKIQSIKQPKLERDSLSRK